MKNMKYDYNVDVKAIKKAIKNHYNYDNQINSV